ncbi:MAG: M56 family metallopeptidase [bacterium]|nr:M56 family metallopeptidase [bacterium]
MGAFFVYILKSAICLALFYLGYRLLLSRDTFLRFNRFALLSGFVLAALLPLVRVGVEGVSPLGPALEEWGRIAAPVEPAATASPAVSCYSIGLAIYLMGVLFFIARFLWGVVSLIRLIRAGRRERLADGSWLVLHRLPLAPFSWLCYIFLAEKDLLSKPELILAHEQAHIRMRHTWDLLFTELFLWLQWFNPAAWLLRQELQAVHEFEADAAVLGMGYDSKEYKLLLIEKAVGSSRYTLANSFNHSSLINRITMMQKRKSNPWARMKYAFVLPVAATAMAAFARPEISRQMAEISSAKITDLSRMVQTAAAEMPRPEAVDTMTTSKEVTVIGYAQFTDKVYESVEVMPEFPGGQAELLKFVAKSIKYPTEAQRRGAQGRVIVKFVVETNGSISNIHVVKGIDPLLDAEAIRVCTTMPTWAPARQEGKAVRCYYTIPVTFGLVKAES